MSKPIIIYDIQVVPEFGGNQGDFNFVMEIFDKEKILLWDSSKSTEGVNCEPKVIYRDDTFNVEVIDTANMSTEEKASKFALLNLKKKEDEDSSME